MIKIEVLHSPSPDEVGIYQFQFDEIIIGATLSNDIILSNQKIKDERIRIYFDGNDLILETTVINQFIILNKKKFSGRLKLKTNDIINFGQCELKILDCLKNQSEDDFPYEKYEKILMNDGPQKDLVIAIENELKKLS